MVEGEDAFKVTYISPAARVMRAEELSGIQRTLSFVVEVANVRPEVLDNIDLDEVVRMFADLTGAPAAIIVSAEGVAKVRSDRAKAQAQQAQLLAAESQAKIAKDMGAAAQSSAKAGIPPQMAMQGMAA
jgi:ATP-dependent 26S proteasome regulatory subunit